MKNKHFVIALIDRDVTQIEIAKKAGIHESRLSKIVNGHLDANDDEKRALSKVLRVPVHALFPETVTP